jgi:hypothetical protein
MKPRTHIIYCLTILALIAVLARYSGAIFVHAMFEKDGRRFLTLERDVTITDASGKKVGIIYRGTTLVSPMPDDLVDSDLGDNQRWKMLVDIDALETSAASVSPDGTFSYLIK